MIRDQLDRIEATLQSFIEEKLASLIPWSGSQGSIARQLTTAVESHLVEKPGGWLTAPNIFTIQVHPSRVAEWNIDPALLNELGMFLEQACQDAGIHFRSAPHIRVAGNTELSINGLLVLARHSEESSGGTAELVSEILPGQERHDTIPGNAFLIINGTRTFQLTLAVVNIGRRITNQLVLDDPRISRNHAQLRAIRGRFVIFDLNSTGGTFVNGERITQYRLTPGDVISLAGVTLIYGEDSPSRQWGHDGTTHGVPADPGSDT